MTIHEKLDAKFRRLAQDAYSDGNYARGDFFNEAAGALSYADDVLGVREPTLGDVKREVARVFGEWAYVHHNDYWCEVVPRIRGNRGMLSASSAVKAPTIAAAYAALRALPDWKGEG